MGESPNEKLSQERSAMNSSEPSALVQKEADHQALIVKQDKHEKEQLQKEVQEELRRQQLKTEILKELQPKTWKDAWSQFAKHPIFITLASFTLTGLVGGWVAVSYQSREWDRQQRQLIKYHQIEERYNIIDVLIKAVAAREASLREVTWKLEYRPDMPEDERRKLDEYFAQSRKEWDAAVATLHQRILIYFHEPETLNKFETFAKRQNITTYPQLLASIHYGLKEPGSARQWNAHTLKIVNDDAQAIQEIVALMVRETEKSY